ncbi:MAG TPA: N-methyl-L-tryptophan oxidase [Candidatus Binatia bacterium]|nr:N-methyl-L-tryptophan oxidase [Candidatus Binatia bacterium]
MIDKFETIVLGLGATGSAALYQLAKRGRKVLGIDRFSPPHNYGSSHGETRIIRQAIGEGEEYVPLVLRSYELWREIENKVGKELLTTTGGLTLESQNSQAVMHGRRNFLDQAIHCAKKFDIRHEILETREIQKRYPQFRVADERGYFEYETGFLRPELCVDAQLHLAKANGASVRTGEKAMSIAPQGNSGVCVQTDSSAYAAESLIVSAGAWIAEFLPASYRKFFKVYRQVMYWFDIKEQFRSRFLPGRFPIFIWIFGQGSEFGFYGFPSLDGKTIKLANEQFAVTALPDEVERAVTRAEEKATYKNYVIDRIPGLSDVCSEALSCLYTMTPDANFVIDFHPESDRIVVASPCSGHGFKHSAAVGEALAELVIDGKSKIGISSFSMKRFK